MSSRSSPILGAAALLATSASPALAKPIAPGLFCDTYPDAPACFGGAPACTLCHSETQAPPALGAYGAELQSALEALTPLPTTEATFSTHLASALTSVEGGDADADGHDNLDEITAGSGPGSAESVPSAPTCPNEEQLADLDYLVCKYDPVFTYRKIGLDFCGLAPSFEEVEAFRSLGAADQSAELHAKLDECLDSQFYLGPNGVVWQIAHRKIRPVGGLKDFADFDDDYNYFTYTQTDGRDVRDVLVGQYLVERVDEEGPDGVESSYRVVDSLPSQPLQPERRAGLLTMAWPLFYNTMFTALPRGTAASAYRAFLGLDIAASEGLAWPVAGEPVDYDGAGVTQAECATCHATLDPLSYPFATYNGLQGDADIGTFQYDPDRIAKYFGTKYPAMLAMPESGVIFGQEVADLLEWAEVAANSDAFYVATTKDYWQLLMGGEPEPEDAASYAEFTALWQSLRDDDDRSVEAMLHRFIETEAYGAP